MRYQVEIGDTPLAVAVSPNSKGLYLGMYGGSLDVVSISNRIIIRRVPLASRPTDIVLDGNAQQLFVGTPSGVEIIEAQTLAVIATVAAGGTPFNLAVDPATHV